MIQSSSRPTHAFVAYRPCGCLCLSCVDLPDLRVEAAESLARAVVDGARPGYISLTEVREASWECEVCTGRSTPALREIRTSPRPDTPALLVRGRVSYQVTLPVQAVVYAHSDVGAEEAVLEAFAPMSLYVESEQIEVEPEFDQELEIESYTAPHPGQMPLPV